MVEMEKFEPELGQLVNGQPWQKFETPVYIDAALEYLACHFDDKKISDDNPFRNTGFNWVNEVFEVHAYDWNENHHQKYNFKYKDIEVSWYKYASRSSSINQEVSVEECWKMLQDCMNSLMVE